ncbi:MAG: biotin--[acetyl-CoA-carboxylase] ligase [Flavobacteriales bacterium]|nr:biotin--[acetyl-CoA-carboxylase] ligase [Flavobacteriales bacterium]
MASFFTTKFIKLEETSSTNDYTYNLLKLAKIKEGTVVSALFQSEGKGQRGTKWESDYGKNILMSIMLSPDITIENQFEINICISLALHDFAKKYFYDKTKIKWPNDLLVKKGKLAGILIKNIIKKDKVKDVIVGIGMNVNQINFTNFSLKATSFKRILNQECDLQKLQKELLDCIESRYLQLKRNEFTKMKEDYLSVLYGFEKEKHYKINNRKIKAKIVGIDEIGKLLLKFENGKIKKFSLKEVVYL